jgi:sulfur-oxidizing protein SoxY
VVTNQPRRQFLQVSSLMTLMVSAGLLPAIALAQLKRAVFESKTLDDALKVLTAGVLEKSSHVHFNVPDVAENGGAVPVIVSTSLKAEQIAILVEKNPNPMAAQFVFSSSAEPFVNARIKMGQTSQVYALVQVEKKWHFVVKEVKVTLGGCGA